MRRWLRTTIYRLSRKQTHRRVSDRFPPSPSISGREETRPPVRITNQSSGAPRLPLPPYACMARGLHRPPVAALDDLSLRGRRLRLQHTVRPHFSPFAPDALKRSTTPSRRLSSWSVDAITTTSHQSHDDMLPPGWVVVLSLSSIHPDHEEQRPTMSYEPKT